MNENLETAVVYVDGILGSDSNPGTKMLPLQTIGASIKLAKNNNKAGTGTRVLINPGVYRESLAFNGGPSWKPAPVTLQAVTNGTVTISGAVPFTHWTVDTANTSIYTAPWSNQWGYCGADGANAPFEQPIVLRRETAFVNGAPMTQVLTLSEVIYPGTFYVDETVRLMYLWPPTGTNMITADVEVGALPSLLATTGLNAVVFRGLTFAYANPCHDASAVTINGSTNIIFDSDQFIWSNGQGLSLNMPSANVTVMNSVAKHNGASGFQTYQLNNVLWQNLESSYNNWRGALGAYYEWNTGGAHIFSDHNETISGFTALYNQTFGIHWDTDVASVNASGILASQNMSGILVEKSEGPVKISTSAFCSAQSVESGAGGLVIRNSEGVTLNNSTLYNNNGTQLLITGVAGGVAVSNWQTGKSYQLVAQNETFTNNTIMALGTQTLFKDGYLGGGDWTSFATTLASNSNAWWQPSIPASFTVPVPSAGTAVNFTGWQNATGQDLNSTFSAPAVDPSSKCTAKADAPDWQLLIDSAGVTSDETGKAVYHLTAASLAGLTGTASLSTNGFKSIAGLTATFSPATLSIPGTSALTITAATKIAPGTYPFTVLANSRSVTRAVTVNVTIPVTSVRLSASSLTFASQATGSISAAQGLTLTNIGSTALRISSIVSNLTAFPQTNTCGTSLAAGAACTISVSFKPNTVQTFNGTITITDSDGTSPQTIPLTGTAVGAPNISCSPSADLFGSVAYLKPSAPLKCKLTNDGSASMAISGVTVTGANASEFSQSNNCGNSLATHASCTITAVFTPSVLGKSTANIAVAGNITPSPYNISLTGTGLTAIVVSPQSLGFGTVTVGKTNPAKRVTMTNSSTAAISISTVTITGTNAGDFKQTNSCPALLAGGASCTLSVTFKPLAKGKRAGTITIKDSDPTKSQIVSLSGSGA